MDLKKISGAAFFGLAVVACLAIMSSHQTEDIKYYGDSLSPGNFAVEEDSSADGASSLFDDPMADDDEDNSDGVESLSGLKSLTQDEDTEEDDDSSSPSGLEDLYSSLGSTAQPTEEAQEPAASSEDSSLSDGDSVTVQYKLRDTNGNEIYRQWGDGDGGEFTFELGGGHVIPGFDSAIAGMSVGQEMDDVTIPADQAYGSKGFAGMGIAPNTDLVYDLKVVSKN